MLPPISVFIPVFNAEKIIENTSSLTYAYLKNNFQDFELVIVDDYSTDNTKEKVKNLIIKFPKLGLAENVNGPSRRENLGRAMLTAKYDIVFFQDADLSVGLENIKPLIENIATKGYDIAVGSRYNGIKPKRSIYRLLISTVFNSFLKIVFKTKLDDNICGFKAFKKQVLFEILASAGYDNTFKRGWFWDAEMMIRAQKVGYSIFEMPIKWKAGKESTFNILRELKMLTYVVDFYRKN